MHELRRLAVMALPASLLSIASAKPPLPGAGSLQEPGSLRVRGAVKHPGNFAPDSLRTTGGLRDLGEIALTKSGGAVKRILTGYRGVLLTDLLDSVGIDAPDRKHLKRVFVVARAKDDYAVVFSWSELFNTPIGTGVFVLLEKDRAPISDAEGPIVLVSAKDTFTGPRHVRWLTSIEVRSA